MGSIINLIRVRQWIKNLLVFAPLAFALDFNGKAISLELIAFSAFCFASSAVYIINDIIDIKSDRSILTKVDQGVLWSYTSSEAEELVKSLFKELRELSKTL